MIDGRSRSVHYWAIDGDRFIGEFQLRLDLTEEVISNIGSIGYAVRVSEWGRGFGSEILKLGLEKAREHGMSEVIFTVNEKNERSIRLIEKTGAVYKDTIEAVNDAEGRHLLRRYLLRL